MATDPDESPRRGRPRLASVDESVLAATLELAGEVGITKMSMDEVAVRAGVSKATIYRRWSSKEALVLDALRVAVTPLDVVDTGTMQGDLDAYFSELVHRYRTGKMRDVVPHLIEVSCHDDNIRASLEEYSQSRRVPLRSIFERAVDRGELATDVDLDVLVDSLLGPFMYRRLLTGDPVDMDFARRLLAVVLPGH